jgi:hypothetical protein
MVVPACYSSANNISQISLKRAKWAIKNRILVTFCGENRALLSSISLLALLNTLEWQDTDLQWKQVLYTCPRFLSTSEKGRCLHYRHSLVLSDCLSTHPAHAATLLNFTLLPCRLYVEVPALAWINSSDGVIEDA